MIYGHELLVTFLMKQTSKQLKGEGNEISEGKREVNDFKNIPPPDFFSSHSNMSDNRPPFDLSLRVNLGNNPRS